MEKTLSPNKTKIDALVRLIEDPDPMIYVHVRDQIMKMGMLVIPHLQDAWNSRVEDEVYRNRIQSIISEIEFNEIKSQLELWKDSTNRDLLKGALIISKLQFPDINESEIEVELEKIKQMVWLEINEENTAFEIVKIFNHVLFELCGFKSSKSNFYSPRNSFINTVLESKKGNPLSLSILYSVIAQKLEIPIYGVNLPNHFVLGFVDEYQTLKLLGVEDDRNILFYINPFSKGRIFDHNEIENYLRSLDLPLQKGYFEPCSNSEILKRMLTNLSYAYTKVGERKKVENLKELQDMLG